MLLVADQMFESVRESKDRSLFMTFVGVFLMVVALGGALAAVAGSGLSVSRAESNRELLDLERVLHAVSLRPKG